MLEEQFYLNEKQIETIVDKIVPLIAAPEDHGVFRFAISEQLRTKNSSSAACFVKRLLDSAKGTQAA